MVPLPNLSLTGGSAAPAISGGGSPQHSVNKGVNAWLAIGAILVVGIFAFKLGGKR